MNNETYYNLVSKLIIEEDNIMAYRCIRGRSECIGCMACEDSRDLKCCGSCGKSLPIIHKENGEVDIYSIVCEVDNCEYNMDNDYCDMWESANV